jgi:hypothetical protein
MKQAKSVKSPPPVWQNLAPAQQAQVTAVLVQMVLRSLNQERQAQANDYPQPSQNQR